MKRHSLLAALCLVLASFSAAQVAVQVSSVQSNTTVTSPIHLHATAASPHPITGWQVYLDSTNVYTGPATGTIDTYVNASNGSHKLTATAWDSTGAFSSQVSQVTVASAAKFTVQVTAPVVNSTSSSPMHVHATASSSYAITGWQVYLDSANVYTGPATGTIDAYVSASQGSHQLTVSAWDASGGYASQALQANVTAPSSLPTPPSTASVFSSIDQMTTGWNSCATAACAGGTGAGAYWQAFNQGSPSLDGRSMEIYHDGSWGNALWWHSMGAKNSATNLLWDFYVQLDSASVNAAQALEYDAYQFVGGYNYMIGTECNYAAGVWDTWSEAGGYWLHTNIPCKKFAPGTWHHIQWYMTTNHTNHTYTYKTLVLDGVAYNLNQTQSAKYLAWGDNIGAQWQLDVNASGTGFHEWVDKATLTVW